MSDEVSLVLPLPPDPDSPGGRFYDWAVPSPGTSTLVTQTLDSLWRRWSPLAAFLELNCTHPTAGPTGVVVAVSPPPAPEDLERASRVGAIPFEEMKPYQPAWEAGASVLVKVDEMPEPLRSRYADTDVEWSLNVPVFAEDVWVGLVGCVTDARGVSTRAVSAFEAAARLLSSEYDATLRAPGDPSRDVSSDERALHESPGT